MRRMKSIKRAAFTLLIALSAVPCFGMRFPDVYFFPFTPDFGFSLVSDRTNTMDVTTKIVIPDEESPDIFYLDWNIKLSIAQKPVSYSLRFVVSTNGDVFLSEMRDESSLRTFDPLLLVFPQVIAYNSPIPIGENMSLKYLKKIPSLKVGERSFNNVILAELAMADETISLYFAEKSGIVGMKNGQETFRKK
jgi:hypothetical protein